MDYNKIKKQLSEAVDIKNKKIESEMRLKIMETIGPDIASSLAPLLAEMAKQIMILQSQKSTQLSTSELNELINKIKI